MIAAADPLAPFAALLSAAEAKRLPCAPLATSPDWETSCADAPKGWAQRNPWIANPNDAALSWARTLRKYPERQAGRFAAHLLTRLNEAMKTERL
jgi:hypothetical protein